MLTYDAAIGYDSADWLYDGTPVSSGHANWEALGTKTRRPMSRFDDERKWMTPRGYF